ncbi:THAP domain-containing protein 1-like [Festucalex cinctus]
MPVCAAINCKSRQFKGCGRTFHLFPLSRPQQLALWMVNMRRDKWTPTRRSLLCSDHFDAECFDRTGQTTRLWEDAVPTIFQLPKHLQKRTKPSRKAPKERNFAPATLNKRNGEAAKSSTPTQAMPKLSVILDDHRYALPVSPATVKKKLDVAFEQIINLQNKVHMLQQRSRRLQGKVTDLQKVVSTLKEDKRISANGKADGLSKKKRGPSKADRVTPNSQTV